MIRCRGFGTLAPPALTLAVGAVSAGARYVLRSGFDAKPWIPVLIFLLGDWLLTAPFMWASADYFWRMAKGEKFPFQKSLRGAFFRQYTRAVGWRIGLWIRMTRAVAIALLPAAFCGALADVLAAGAATWPMGQPLAAVFNWLSVFGWLGAGVRIAAVRLSYLPSLYLCLGGMPVGAAFGISREWMRGYVNRAIGDLYLARLRMAGGRAFDLFAAPTWCLAKATWVADRLKRKR